MSEADAVAKGVSRLRKRAVWAGGIIVVLVYVAAAGALLAPIRSQLLEARKAAQAGIDAMAEQDFGLSQERFDAAHRDLARASSRLGNPLLLPIRTLPFAKRNLSIAHLLTAHGADITARAADVAAALDDLPGGVSAMVPRNGRIPTHALSGLIAPLDELSATIAKAAGQRFDIRGLHLAMREAVVDYQAALRKAEGSLRPAAAVAHALPDLLGADQPRRYFFAAANPAELRGAGGFIGAYAIATIDDGAVSFSEFAPSQSLEDLPSTDVPAPNDDFHTRYDRYGGAGFWQNLNMTPDFPSAASAIERLYHQTTGQTVDGVILADPFALQALLEVTGPVDIPGIGQVTADRIVDVVANEAFGAFPDPVQRKRLLGAVAAGIFSEFLSGSAEAEPLDAAKALGKAVSQGNLLIHSADPEVQGHLEIAGVAGELQAPEGDYLSVVGNNASATKLDYYADRSVDYRVALDDDGRGTGSATVKLTNSVPDDDDLPRYVVGPYSAAFQPRENATILNVYCRQDCAVHRFRRDGVVEPVRAERELGHPVFWSYERMLAGETRQVQYDWLLSKAWDRAAGEGRYRLTFQNQVTIRPTRVRLEVRVPAGMDVVSTTLAMTREGAALVWQGDTRGDVELEVRFREPARSWWQRVRGWLGRPLGA